MAVETEVVPCVVAMDINVHVAMDKDIIAIAELAAGFDATLRVRAHLNRTLAGRFRLTTWPSSLPQLRKGWRRNPSMCTGR